MGRNGILGALAVVGVVATISIATASAQTTAAPSQFDGSWQVTLVCAAADDGARGYTWRFPATVANGHLHGEYNAQGAVSSMVLDGRIRPDGSAGFTGHGFTGNPAATVGRVNQGTPFLLRASGRFDGNHGSAIRTNVRPCTLDFVRG